MSADHVESVAASLRRLVRLARSVGVRLVADAGAEAVRVMSAEDLDEAYDLSEEGVAVAVHGACGGPAGGAHEAVCGAVTVTGADRQRREARREIRAARAAARKGGAK